MVLAILQRFGEPVADQAAGWRFPPRAAVYRSPCCVMFAGAAVSVHRQPVGADGDRSGIVAAFDGRLDNRQELLAEYAGSDAAEIPDSALIGQAYLRHGQGWASKAVGDFRALIYDERDRTLTGSVDIACSRRLWWRERGPLVILGSNIGDLYDDDEGVRVNHDYLSELLGYSWVSGRIGPLSGTSRLLPAESMRASARSVQVRKYWCPTMFATDTAAPATTDHVAEFSHLFRQAVRRRLPRHGSLLCDLSGGLDSTSITSMAGRLLGGDAPDRLHAVTVTYPDAPGSNEEHLAVSVANAAGATHHLLKMGSQETFFGGLPENAFYWDEPKINVHSYSSADKKRGILQSLGSTVVFSGAGAEALLGAHMSWPVFLADAFIRGRWGEVADGVTRWRGERRAPLPLLIYKSCIAPLVCPVAAMTAETTFSCRPWMTSAAARRAAQLLAARPRPVVNRWHSASAWMAEQWQGAGMAAEFGLAAHAYETRFPYLDRSLVEGVLKMPWSVRAHPRYPKFLLRQQAVDLLPEGFAKKPSRGADQAVGRALGAQIASVRQRLTPFALAELGLVDQTRLLHTLSLAAQGLGGGARPTVTVIGAEFWTRSVLSGDWRRQQIQRLRPAQAAA